MTHLWTLSQELFEVLDLEVVEGQHFLGHFGEDFTRRKKLGKFSEKNATKSDSVCDVCPLYMKPLKVIGGLTSMVGSLISQ